MTPVLTRWALNRVTLERQLLLRRASGCVVDVVEHLVGLVTLTIRLYRWLSRQDADAVVAEGLGLLELAAAGAKTCDLRIVAPD